MFQSKGALMNLESVVRPVSAAKILLFTRLMGTLIRKILTSEVVIICHRSRDQDRSEIREEEKDTFLLSTNVTISEAFQIIDAVIGVGT
jgi:hypothetical protein